MIPKVYGLKFYTKTRMERVSPPGTPAEKRIFLPKMYGVIEAPINKMMKAYPEEFSFMRHETMRDQRPSKGKKNG